MFWEYFIVPFSISVKRQFSLYFVCGTCCGNNYSFKGLWSQVIQFVGKCIDARLKLGLRELLTREVWTQYLLRSGVLSPGFRFLFRFLVLVWFIFPRYDFRFCYWVVHEGTRCRRWGHPTRTWAAEGHGIHPVDWALGFRLGIEGFLLARVTTWGARRVQRELQRATSFVVS